MVNEKSGSQSVRQLGGSVGVFNLIPREKRKPLGTRLGLFKGSGVYLFLVHTGKLTVDPLSEIGLITNQKSPSWAPANH